MVEDEGGEEGEKAIPIGMRLYTFLHISSTEQ